MNVATDRSLDSALDALEQVLRVQREGYGRLLEALYRKREAIKCAELERVGEIAKVELTMLERLHELDVRREAAIEGICSIIGIEFEGVTVSAIAQAIDEQRGVRLLALADELRTSIERARSESSIIKTAGEALARHMAGVMQSVRGVLANAGIYGNQGRITTGIEQVSGLDVSS